MNCLTKADKFNNVFAAGGCIIEKFVVLLAPLLFKDMLAQFLD